MLCQGWRSYMLNPDKVIFREAFAPQKIRSVYWCIMVELLISIQIGHPHDSPPK